MALRLKCGNLSKKPEISLVVTSSVCAMPIMEPAMIDRPRYRADIEPYIDIPLVKVLAGVRRSGKSTLLNMIKEQLVHRGISPERFVHYSFDSLAFTNMKTSTEFHQMIAQRISSTPARTYLIGRYVSIPVYPLSFSEFLEFKRARGKVTESPYDELASYMRRGGFPVTSIGDLDDDQAYRIINDIYASIVLKDIVQKNDIRIPELLERIVRFVFDNAGKTFSAKSISDYLKSQQRVLGVETVYNYLLFLEKAFLLYRYSRFDIRGKEILKTREKFYLVDTSLRHALLGYEPTSTAALLENVVYLELKRRGFDVYVGKLGSKEIDFVAERQGSQLYIQVAREINDETTEHREYDNLLAVRDGYPKYVLRTDAFAAGSHQGVLTMHVADFLLSDTWG